MYREKRIAELMGVGRDDLIEYVLRLERMMEALRWTEWLYVEGQAEGQERSCLRCLRKESQGHYTTCPLSSLLHDPGCDSLDIDPAIGRVTKPCNCSQQRATTHVDMLTEPRLVPAR